MNTKYNKVTVFKDTEDKLKKAVEIVSDITIPDDIPHGDMPGDKIEIGESHIAKAKTIFPLLIKELLLLCAEDPELENPKLLHFCHICLKAQE